MRSLILVMLAALLGAAAFHVYYLRLNSSARCGWDHPFDAQAKADCRAVSKAVGSNGYVAKARRDLDSLIGRVAY